MDICYCGSTLPYPSCCGLYITGTKLPSTPEQLMRSRYTAYVVGNLNYIQQTMCGLASQQYNHDTAAEWSKNINWLGLKVLKTNFYQDRGFVEFIAAYKENGKRKKIHEISQFNFIDGKWYYTQGKSYKK